MNLTHRVAGGIAMAAAVGCTAIAVVPPTAASAGASTTANSAGSPGLGDPYFPLLGDGGYDPSHYTLSLGYDPATHNLSGVVSIDSRATQDLAGFDLDLVQGMQVSQVTVNGTPASWSHVGSEIVIQPKSGIQRGSSFVTAVTYAGSPQTITNSPIVFGSSYGWLYTTNGAFVGNEPNAANTWFPSNDYPTKKASFTYQITVPQGESVVANGRFLSQSNHGGNSTFVWDESRPMPTYLATIDIGNWQFIRGRTANGIPETVAINPSLNTQGQGQTVFDTTAAITDYWSKVFGPYPWHSTGAIVDDVPAAGWSLETVTRPIYSSVPGAGGMSHELAHQWFGDSVSVKDWSNIWLNEGFATFASWLWTEHTGGATTWQTLQSQYKQIPATSSFWNVSVGSPATADQMFSSAIYTRGGMTLAALRQTIGDGPFFELLRDYATTYRYGNATTANFIALAEKVSRQDLTGFFNTWLYQPSKPATLPAS